MTAAPTPTAVVFVADVSRVSRFYRELAGMRVLLEDASHVVLGIDGFELVVHALHGEPQVGRTIDGDIPIREDSYVKICLPVRSLSAARSTATALGGGLRPAEQEWEARGFRACDGHDPEGNVIQVRVGVDTPS